VWYPDVCGGSVGPNGVPEGPRSFALGRCFGSLVRTSVGVGFFSSLGDAVFRGGGIWNGKIQTIKKRSFHNLEITSLSLSGNKITKFVKIRAEQLFHYHPFRKYSTWIIFLLFMNNFCNDTTYLENTKRIHEKPSHGVESFLVHPSQRSCS
jgi:hypothetical protein